MGFCILLGVVLDNAVCTHAQPELLWIGLGGRDQSAWSALRGGVGYGGGSLCTRDALVSGHCQSHALVARLVVATRFAP